MTNNEKFNQMVNSCKHPRAIMAAMMALAPYIQDARAEQQRKKEGDTWHEQHADDP